jgi:uncharacterized protein
MRARVSALFVYPVKSMRGIALERATIAARGFVDDRRWMVVDAGGSFLTQRALPEMARISARRDGEHLVLAFDGVPELRVVAEPRDGTRRTVRVWDDTCGAVSLGDEAARWLESALGVRCDLVTMPDETRRLVDPTRAREDDVVGFADGFPFLLTTESSLASLSARMDAPLPMNRFRPNLVVSGTEPFEEDAWARIQVGEVAFRVAKPCGRCVITATDQETAARGVEPLRTLATFRKIGKDVVFGQNLIHDGRGEVRIGDEVRVLVRSAS